MSKFRVTTTLNLQVLYILFSRGQKIRWVGFFFFFPPQFLFSQWQCVHSGLQGSQANVSRSQCSHMSKLPSVSMTTGWTFRFAWTPVTNKSCLYSMTGYKKPIHRVVLAEAADLPAVWSFTSINLWTQAPDCQTLTQKNDSDTKQKPNFI